MSPKRVLLVDDEAIVTRTLKLYLDDTGSYDVRTLNEASRAVEVVRAFRPDVILLDLIMPDTDGATVAAELQEDQELKRIPIVFLTALVSKDEVGTAGKKIGGRPFLAKPVDPDEVIHMIERVTKP